MILTETYHGIIRTLTRAGLRVGMPGDGPYVDVVATPTHGHHVNDPCAYSLQAVTEAGRAYLATVTR